MRRVHEAAIESLTIAGYGRLRALHLATGPIRSRKDPVQHQQYPGGDRRGDEHSYPGLEVQVLKERTHDALLWHAHQKQKHSRHNEP